MTDDTSILKPTSEVDVQGHPLELGRPELAPMAPRDVSTPSLGVMSPPTILLVTRVPGEELPLSEALKNDGWSVTTCKGPAEGKCPIMSGEACPKRSDADIAIVFVDPKATPGGGNLPRFCCAADDSSPGIVAMEGRFDPPTFRGGIALVGALRGSEGLLTTIAALKATEEGTEDEFGS